MNIYRDSVLRQALTGAVAVAASVGLALPAAALPADGAGEAPTGDCDIEQIREDIGVPEMDMVMFCDGDWARVGKYQTDYILNPYFDAGSGTWVVPPYDGQVTEGLMHGCYTAEHIDALGGAPEEAVVPICDPATSTLY